MNVVMRVIETLSPPTQAELARVTGKYPQEVTRWVKRGKFPAAVLLDHDWLRKRAAKAAAMPTDKAEAA